jgi:hypothetical protein
VETRYDDLIAALREAAQPKRAAPAAMRSYLEKVRGDAYRVTDRDVEKLLAEFSEDDVFEQTVATAVSAGLGRLDAALRVLR